MQRLIVYQIDSFTQEKFKGNPAGVVLNADGLTEIQMQQIARELNNSETAFLFSSDDNDCNGVIRYFTPKVEVPTCGHATIAAMYAKAVHENLDSCVLKIKTQIGVLQFEIIKNERDYEVVMTQGRFESSPMMDDDLTRSIVSALGLTESDLDKNCPIQIATTGNSKVIIGIQHREKLNSLDPNMSMLISLSEKIGCNGYFVFTFETGKSEILTCGRMFAPAIGIPEDPVTGNAHGPLGGYLVQNKIVEYADEVFEFKGSQGEKMGRPGIVEVKVKIKNGEPTLVQIQGSAVVIFKTSIEV